MNSFKKSVQEFIMAKGDVTGGMYVSWKIYNSILSGVRIKYKPTHSHLYLVLQAKTINIVLKVLSDKIYITLYCSFN